MVTQKYERLFSKAAKESGLRHMLNYPTAGENYRVSTQTQRDDPNRLLHVYIFFKHICWIQDKVNNCKRSNSKILRLDFLRAKSESHLQPITNNSPTFNFVSTRAHAWDNCQDCQTMSLSSNEPSARHPQLSLAPALPFFHHASLMKNTGRAIIFHKQQCLLLYRHCVRFNTAGVIRFNPPPPPIKIIRKRTINKVLTPGSNFYLYFISNVHGSHALLYLNAASNVISS